MNTNHEIIVSSLVDFEHRAIDVQQTSATVETYVFYREAAMTNIVGTIVVTYTDSTKSDIDTVVRT